MNDSSDWIRVASAADVAEGEALGIEVMGLNLALYHIGDEWFCTDNVCTHAFALLSDGWLEGHVIECPLHAGQFDVRTGKGLGDPIETDLKTFPVRVDGDAVMIALP
ncbi:MAG: non-heme iron oxygenase ferredoxin subunit [Acetobacteraceae bacterium]